MVGAAVGHIHKQNICPKQPVWQVGELGTGFADMKTFPRSGATLI
jgi:hypothetical protein